MALHISVITPVNNGFTKLTGPKIQVTVSVDEDATLTGQITNSNTGDVINADQSLSVAAGTQGTFTFTFPTPGTVPGSNWVLTVNGATADDGNGSTSIDFTISSLFLIPKLGTNARSQRHKSPKKKKSGTKVPSRQDEHRKANEVGAAGSPGK
jgi:hypothetical protein